MHRYMRDAAVGFASLGVALALAYASTADQAVQAVCMSTIALGSATSLFVSPAANGAELRLPWRLIGAAATVFLVGVVVRPWAEAQSGPAVFTADAATLAGYGLLLAGLSLLIRSRGRLEPHAVADGVIVCLGVLACAAVVLALPASRVHGRPVMVSLMAGAYPVIDVVLLLLLLNLVFTTAGHLASYRAMAFAMVTLLIGDIGYAWIGAHGQLTGSRLLDLPFILTYTFFGVAVLHPSMTQLSSAQALPVQAWSWLRLSLIIPALALPAGLLIGRSNWPTAERLVLALAVLGQVTTLLVRAVTAVRDYAHVQATLWHQARHDPLTGLANRVQLTELVDQQLRRGRRGSLPMWLLFLDLDGFKLVNDSWGHETGDQLLREVAARLAALPRPSLLVSRIGGDEFVLAGRMSAEQADGLAADIQEAMSAPIVTGGLDLVVTTSVGLARADAHGSAEALLRDADTAMYRAKAEGRDRVVVFDASMRQTVRDRVEIELALRHAIAREQLWIAYQPIVDVADGRITGAEALLRWNHPVRGDITPAEFIPVAEETGLIVDIGEWVLRESTRQLGAWQSRPWGKDFFVSVNVSARQLRDGRFPATVADALMSTGVEPARLVLEITESVMLERAESVTQGLDELRGLGVQLAVDDFGTGYSSLGYLSRYPVTGVKIDRSFVAGLGERPGDEAIVRAVTAMAQALNLTVVAEGVETDSQWHVLQRLGIPRAQGWLWGRAVDAAAFSRLLHGSRPEGRQAQPVAGNS